MIRKLQKPFEQMFLIIIYLLKLIMITRHRVRNNYRMFDFEGNSLLINIKHGGNVFVAPFLTWLSVQYYITNFLLMTPSLSQTLQLPADTGFLVKPLFSAYFCAGNFHEASWYLLFHHQIFNSCRAFKSSFKSPVSLDLAEISEFELIPNVPLVH